MGSLLFVDVCCVLAVCLRGYLLWSRDDHCSSLFCADEDALCYDNGVVLERYRLGKCLYVKWGCMVVFQADDTHATMRQVVVKIAIETTGPEYDQMINEHSLLTGALQDCPGVPKVLGWGFATCTRFQDAPTQARVLVQSPLGMPLYALSPLAIEDLGWIGERLAVILREIHARGVLHRDIKPDNVIITPNDELIIIDYGLSIAVGVPQPTLEGTRAYCAPSICCLGRSASVETDYISLVYTMMAMERGSSWWLACEDQRDQEDEFGPCYRPCPAKGTLPCLLVENYLGAPVESAPSLPAHEKRWFELHLKLVPGYETGGIGMADKEKKELEADERRREAERLACEARQAEEQAAESKRVQEEEAARRTETALKVKVARQEQEHQKLLEQEAANHAPRRIKNLLVVAGAICLLALWRRRH